MNYTVFRPDGSEAIYSLSYQDLKCEHERFCEMADCVFLANVRDAAHLACIISFLKELPAGSTLGDQGIVHQLIHLMTIEGTERELPEIRKQFAEVLRLA